MTAWWGRGAEAGKTNKTDLPGSEMKQESSVQIFTVKDRKKWNEEAIPKLAGTFGETIVKAYVNDLSGFDPRTEAVISENSGGRAGT